MDLYCENCFFLCEADRCPLCRGKRLREVRGDDAVFLTTLPYLEAELLQGVLKDEGIEVFNMTKLGAGIRAYVGQALEKEKLYVKYQDLDRANGIKDSLFNADEVVED